MPPSSTSPVAISRALGVRLGGLTFPTPADVVYRPTEYARPIHEAYLETYGAGRKRVLFLGMNPGPDGMGQTGVPFGDVVAVRDWMGLRGEVTPPGSTHPRRPVLGLAATRREPSGARLWGFFEKRFGTPGAFFADAMVWNYCPLLFFENTAAGRNVTPEQLPVAVMRPVEVACDEALRALVAVWRPEWVVGVGRYAEARAKAALAGVDVRITRLEHPSPANPGANGDWAGRAEAALVAAGVWTA